MKETYLCFPEPLFSCGRIVEKQNLAKSVPFVFFEECQFLEMSERTVFLFCFVFDIYHREQHVFTVIT